MTDQNMAKKSCLSDRLIFCCLLVVAIGSVQMALMRYQVIAYFRSRYEKQWQKLKKLLLVFSETMNLLWRSFIYHSHLNCQDLLFNK